VKVQNFTASLIQKNKYSGLFFDFDQPYFTFTGNIIVEKEVCKLIDVENYLLGVPPYYKPQYSQFRKIHVRIAAFSLIVRNALIVNLAVVALCLITSIDRFRLVWVLILCLRYNFGYLCV